ncbi:hypothetical protein AB0C76_33005 [Kitasatospora sp. NPDC048722]|uniref:hypothetical protein n=1 Tax=Kitasatospora sp. NPDC048722 TaxID=3155639 RepID=UPI0033DB2E74
MNPSQSHSRLTGDVVARWHYDVDLFGEPYPTRHPVPDHFRTGAVTASELMGLTPEQGLAAVAAHELGHAVPWLACGLRVRRISIVPDGRLGGHAMALPTGVDDEIRWQAVGVASGERAEDRWLREAGLWSPDRAAVTEMSACQDRAWLMEHTTPRPTFGSGDGLDFTVLHDMADSVLDQVWGRLTAALPVLVRQRVMSGEELAECTGLPFPSRR